MSMLMQKHEEFEPVRTKKALDMLSIDRNNEFRELAQVIFLQDQSSMNMENSREFILCFCLDMMKAFKTWSGDEPLVQTSPMKALTILRQLSRNQSTMTQLIHLLNIAYTLAEEFKIIYKRIE